MGTFPTTKLLVVPVLEKLTKVPLLGFVMDVKKIRILLLTKKNFKSIYFDKQIYKILICLNFFSFYI
jgi:hypothetical protein